MKLTSGNDDLDGLATSVQTSVQVHTHLLADAECSRVRLTLSASIIEEVNNGRM